MARTLEKSELQASDMEKTHSNKCASVKSLSLQKPHARQPNTRKHQGHSKPQGQTKNHNNYQKQTQYQTKHKACRNCGVDWPHSGGRQGCPAQGQICHSCSKPNHYGKCCHLNSRGKPKSFSGRYGNKDRHNKKYATHNNHNRTGNVRQ